MAKHAPFGLRSSFVLCPGGLRAATVVVQEGRIRSVEDAPPKGLEVLDLGERWLVPGLVDSHVHINEPGRTDWEGYATATRAAAAGGVTTLVDMPLNCMPVTTSRDALATKLAAARGQLSVDCGFWGGVVPGNAAELPGMAEDGILGAKAFLCHSGIDDFPAARREDLLLAMPELRAAGLPLLVHAELDFSVNNPWDDASPRDYIRYLHSRPKVWEDAAIARVIDLVRATGCRAHIVHLSSGSALPMLRAARAEGLPISVETCPHYLCLSAEDIPPGDTSYKCAPPIRGSDNQEALWEGLSDGTIDFVVTDHSPCLPSLKLPERGDFLEAWGGIASLQFGLAGVWASASLRGIPAPRVLRWMSEAPASFLGLAGRKGTIVPGADADLVAWEPDPSWTIESDSVLHRHPQSPWVGRSVRGRIERVWLRGEEVASGGEIVQDAPTGQAILGCHTGGCR